jgi:molybdate transport system substrate-binding protein
MERKTASFRHLLGKGIVPARAAIQEGWRLSAAVSFLLVVCCTFSSAQPITVAAAADLTSALAEVAQNYQKQTGQEVKLSFGGSGNLTSQIQNGAPFDLFFSADEDYPKKLIDAGLADQGSLYRYAAGRLVLWVPAPSTLDIEHRGLKVLMDPSVTKIAIANPQHAPYGRAAEAALRHVGIYDKVSSKLVLGENVAQAAQFVESGNAQVGLVALSHAIAPQMVDKGRYWLVPLDDYPTLNQALVILSKSSNKKQAQAFLDYVRTPEVTTLMGRYGFSMSEAPQK